MDHKGLSQAHNGLDRTFFKWILAVSNNSKNWLSLFFVFAILGKKFNIENFISIMKMA